MISEFEEEKERIKNEIAELENQYTSALSNTLNNKKIYFATQKKLNNLEVIKNTKIEVERKIDSNVNTL